METQNEEVNVNKNKRRRLIKKEKRGDEKQRGNYVKSPPDATPEQVQVQWHCSGRCSAQTYCCCIGRRRRTPRSCRIFRAVLFGLCIGWDGGVSDLELEIFFWI